MAKRMLADVIWTAANEHLRVSERDFQRHSLYTCDAVNLTIYKATPESGKREAAKLAAEDFLESLGLLTPSNNFDAFNAFEYGEERQGVRYMWLLLAMHVAEDEGIEL